MPASLPGDTAAHNTTGNPTLGPLVIFDPLSGPLGSLYDKDIAGNASTGGLSTGIGIGGNIINSGAIQPSWDDNIIPGERPTYAAPPPAGVVSTNTIDSTRLYIGGGRSVSNSTAPDKYARPFLPSPYTAGVAIAGAGGGSPRDIGAGAGGTAPFYGAPVKMVTATGAVAAGAAVETGFVNATNKAMVSGQSTWGVAAAALAAPSLAGADTKDDIGGPNTPPTEPGDVPPDGTESDPFRWGTRPIDPTPGTWGTPLPEGGIDDPGPTDSPVIWPPPGPMPPIEVGPPEEPQAEEHEENHKSKSKHKK